MHCAFLTTDKHGLTEDDRWAAKALEERGATCTALSWSDAQIDWSTFDCAVIRSTWDYHRQLPQFLQRLAKIDAAGARLMNSLAQVQWNADKSYLRDLAACEVEVVPTLWGPWTEDEAIAFVAANNAERLVVKPTVGASASGVRSLAATDREESMRLSSQSAGLMLQPLVQSVVDEGEYSLIFFSGSLSHTVLKRPARGDYRVQGELGGNSVAVDPPASLVQAAENVLAVLDELPLYARVDMARASHGSSYWLMELELIEPELFLRHEPKASERFAAAILENCR